MNRWFILCFLVCFICFVTKGQVVFKKKPVPLEVLNSELGQNHFMVSPHYDLMVYSEESDLNSITQKVIDTDTTTFYSIVFRNSKKREKLYTPIGFLPNGEFIFAKTVNQGRYVTEFLSSIEEMNKVEIPYFYSKSDHISGSVSRDGNFMLLAFEGNNTSGVEDLYLVKRTSSGWSSPQSLGAKLNTPYQEITPYLATDNKTLFFSTNGRGGKGSFDIFYTTRLDDTWRNWSEPKALKKLNSEGSETSFSIKGDYAYLIRSEDSDGYGDIYMVRLQTEFDEADSVIIEQVPIPVKTEKTTKKWISVYDNEFNKKLNYSIVANNETIAKDVDYFEFELLNHSEIEIKSTGYFPQIIEVEKLESGQNTIRLDAIAVGSSITLEHVFFYRGTTQLIEDSEQDLQLVIEMLTEYPGIKIKIKGHTDNQGDPVRNKRLSEGRAKAVKQYLIEHGVNPYRLSGVGYGGAQPRASNETEETRRLNRRVEFEIIEN